MTTIRQALLLFVLSITLPVMAWAEAGRIMFALGSAEIVHSDGSSIKAKRGSVINSGDQIKTSENGQVQIKMDDGGLIAVRPNSIFSIDDFKNTGDVTQDKSFFSLMKGGFRSVTGTVGEKNKAAYKVTTPVATIGIRGTDYSARLCAGDCDSSTAQDGLYVGVFSGGVSLTNDVGIIDVAPTEYGYVENQFSVPQNIETAPDNLLFAQSGTTETTSDSATTTVASTTEPTEASTALPKLANDGTDLASGATTATPVTRVLNALTGNTLTGSNITTTDTVIAGTGELQSFTATYPSVTEVSYSAGADIQHIEYGSDTDTGIKWGRWNGGTMTADGTNQTLSDSNSMHWIASLEDNAVELPKTGTASYVSFGGTNPTDGSGNVGTLTTSLLTADFSKQSVEFSMSASIMGPDNTNPVTWTASTTSATAIPMVNGGFSGDISTVKANYFQQEVGSGHVSGMFTSATDIATGNPAGALSAYHLDSGTIDGPVELNGTIAYRLQ